MVLELSCAWSFDRSIVFMFAARITESGLKVPPLVVQLDLVIC